MNHVRMSIFSGGLACQDDGGFLSGSSNAMILCKGFYVESRFNS